MSGRHEHERQIDDRLADWVDGCMSDRERERFVAELRVSPQLRKDLEEYERTVAAVRAALRAPTAPVAMADRVLAAIAAPMPVAAARAAGGRRPRLVWSVLCAAALLALAVWLNTWEPPVATTDSAASEGAAALALRDEVKDRTDLREAAAPAGAPQAKPNEQGVEMLEELAAGAKPGASDQKPLVEQRVAFVQAPVAEAAPNPATPPPTDALRARSDVPKLDGRAEAPVGGAGGGVSGVATVAPGAPVPQLPPPGAAMSPDAATGVFSLDSRTGAARPEGSAVGEQARENTAKADAEVAPARPEAAGPEAAKRRGAQPTDRIEVTKTATGSPLPLIVVRAKASVPGAGTWADRQRSTGGASRTDVPAQLDLFFAMQMEPPAEDKKVERKGQRDQQPVSSSVADGNLAGSWSATVPTQIGGLQLQSLQLPARPPEAGALRDGPAAPAARKDADQRAVAAAERVWLVEGPRAEIAQLLRRLRDFVRATGLELQNAEEPADSPWLPPAAADGEAAKATEDRVRIVLRFQPQTAAPATGTGR